MRVIQLAQPLIAPGGPAKVELSGGNDDKAKNLKACIGECDNDGQCAAGLRCFQREKGEAIPGCKGSGGGKNWDYCYDPAAVKTFNIGSKSYNQCQAKCNSKGLNLASKKQLLNFFTLPGGGPRKQSGDVWTPVFGANDWLQLGNGRWPFGKLHTEIEGGKHKKPSWGNKVQSFPFKRNFYCTK